MMPAPNFHDEQELVLAFRDGDADAFDYLFEGHFPSLGYFAEVLIKDREKAKEIAASAFIKLLSRKQDLHSLSNIKAFLFVATRNACYDFLRDAKSPEVAEAEISYLHSNAEYHIQETEIIADLYKEISNAPDEWRDFISRHLIKDSDTKKIAEQLNIQTTRN